jgi:8-hydroxy-5-deazaflavin:NADPH oxidoreductase
MLNDRRWLRNRSGAIDPSRSYARRTRPSVSPASAVVQAQLLFGVYEARRRSGRPSLVYCGDHAAAKDIAAGLIRDSGFEPVDAGPLRVARHIEPFALLIGELAYGGADGPELAYGFERFGQRD